MASSSSSSSTGVPPGFRFHPTDEELLLYYLKKKVSLQKFDLEVVREVDLNKIEPWDLQERCRIGATPQNEWYFFSHKDRKYPTGSRTNRATNAGFWKATGRDKSIRNTYKKIGMRKTLVFYRGRAPHGQKTDWIMHEYRLEELEDDQDGGSEDGWVVCRVFKKKCFFKPGGSEGSSSSSQNNRETNNYITSTTSATNGLYMQHTPQSFHHQLLPSAQPTNLYRPELGLTYTSNHPYSQIQVQDLLPRPPYDFSVLPHDSSSDQIHHQQPGRDASDWAMIDTTMDQNQNLLGAHQQQQRGGEMDLWGYGK